MAKICKICLLIILFPLFAISQNYGNEWIDYSQKYYKFNVIKDGVYQLSYNTLISAGIPVDNINPRQFQIFGRGEELYIHVEGESNNVFEPGEFIEFYAQRNDGWLDTLLYENPLHQPNPHYSLITDTATYYFTWNPNSVNNKRFAVETATDTTRFNLPYFFKKEVQYFSTIYNFTTSDPVYTEGEGWLDGAIGLSPGLSASTIKSFNTPFAYTGGPSANVLAAVAGSTYNPLRAAIDYSVNGNTWNAVIDTSFSGYKTIRSNNSISVNQFGQTTAFRVSSLQPSSGATTGRMSLAYLSLKYPHTFNLENSASFYFYLHNTSQSQYRLEFSALSLTGNAFIYDLTANRRANVSVNTTTGKANVSMSNTVSMEKEYVIFSSSGVISVTSVSPVNATGFFKNYLTINPNANYLILTHKILLQEAQAYSNYRSSIAGGSYNCAIIDVDDLYDQFAYGIRKNPLAVKRFVNFAYDKFNIQPKYLYILGKGIYSNTSRKSNANFALNLIPSWGEPPSDNLMCTPLSNNSYTPVIAVGRLAAKNLTEAANFRNKVVDHEDNLAEEWMKQILHFAGGITSGEQTAFQNYVKQYENILENIYFGGNVHTFKKTSSAPIVITTLDSIRNLINNGVSIMTFFGHSAGSSFDQSIEEASAYQNQGKHPLLVANSCLIGDIFLPSSDGTSERWMLIPDKGTIGFLAQVGLGYENQLFQYTSRFFTNLGKDMYGQGIGACMKQAIQSTIQTYGNAYRTVCLEMTLHGDPAVVLNAHPDPDLLVNSSSVYFNPGIVTSEQASFDLNVIITNIGKATNDSFTVQLTRHFPTAVSPVVYIKTVYGAHYKDTITFTLPVDVVNGLGLNEFDVFVDASNKLIELSETNNNLSKIPLFISSSAISPAYPAKYAIVPTNQVILKATTGDPFAPLRSYRFEIDTTDIFNSPSKLYQLVSQTGGVINALPNLWKNANTNSSTTLNLEDSMVYFWRVTPDTVNSTNGTIWKESSFQHISGKRGWEQAHFYQFKNDRYKFLNYNRSQRNFEFAPNSITLSAKSFGTPTTAQLYETGYKIDAALYGEGGCQPRSALHVAVIDSITLQPWSNRDYFFNNNNFPAGSCHYGRNYSFNFWTNDAIQMAGLNNLLQSVPSGSYILMYNFFNYNVNWADTSAFQTLVDLGISGVRNKARNIPFIYFIKKGSPSLSQEMYGIDTNSAVTFETILTASWSYGEITSEIIGPSLSWDSLYWHATTDETGNFNDSIRISISGINNSGLEIPLGTLAQGVKSARIDSISAIQYPFLKLKAYLRDDSLHTPLHLKRWHVIYEPAPECAINQAKHFKVSPGSNIQEGDNIKVEVAIENIGDVNMDSLLVYFSLQDRNRIMHPLQYKRYKKLAVADTVIASVSLSSLGYSGANSIWIEANPFKPGTTTYDQTEQYHFNNFAQIKFNAEKDKTNPLLDVTFDGVHILNGDIVSPKPEIVIQLKDENKYNVLDTSSFVRVFVKYPGQNTERLLSFNDTLEFIPAKLPENKCKIIYKPLYPEDGTYELRVQANDASGNKSGAIDYRISFEVINKSTITEVMNYPNPFSTSTRFVFTLTGSEIPSYFKIQIMTVTGKVVKEIFAEDLGPIHIGRNITEYAWDGKDEYGDILANGIYLYRVVTNINGNTIEKRETKADQYFHKGFGKMYLVR